MRLIISAYNNLIIIQHMDNEIHMLYLTHPSIRVLTVC